jgi:uncharacterized RmlC-like cupin family protein
MTEQLRVIRSGELTSGPATPGMRRSEAVATERVWAGVVHTEPGAFSGWHHHGDHESVIYVATGTLRMESGERGEDIIEAEPGDFVYVPPHVVHREGNTTDLLATLVVTRCGQGPSVINVGAPGR